MAVDMGSLFMRNLGELRVQPTRKRVRAKIDGETIVDSSRAVLVWEPKRVVPAYAVPVEDVVGGTRPTSDPAEGDGRDYSRIPVWDPRVPFAVRTTAGRPVAVGPDERPVAGFIAEDADLGGYVVLDFDGFDTWLEEDEEIISHPHDPFSRIDIRDSSARYQLALDGEPVVDTTRARILFETGLPPRHYVPRGDVLVDLAPSSATSTCAYKGVATYHSPIIDGHPVEGLVWSYESPLSDGEGVRGRLCFFDERMDVTIDGVALPRPKTYWS